MSSLTGRSRWLAIAAALAGACLLALAVTSPGLGRWWSIGDAVAIGPGGITSCRGDDCVGYSLELLGGTSTWRTAGIAVSVASMITTGTLIAVAAAIAARRRGALAAGATLTATLTAAIAGVVFVATFPDGQPATLDRGVFLYAAGIVLAAGLSIVILRPNQ